MYCFKLDKLKYNRKEKIAWILSSGIVNKDVWLAGGSLRTMIDSKDTICDYDLFFKHQEARSISFDELLNDNASKNKVQEVRDKLKQLGFKCTFECPEGKLYTYEKTEITPIKSLIVDPPPNKKWKIQLICEFFYDSPEHLLSTFDLSPCLFCTDGEFLWTTKRAIESVKKKVLTLHNVTYPTATMKRIIKYALKGYKTNLACQSFIGNLYKKHNIQVSENELRVYID